MILVFGRTGQVAQELARLAPEAHFAGRDEADLTHPDDCAALIGRLRPAAVINAAAYTAVDKAEADETTARLVNRDAPEAMAVACAGLLPCTMRASISARAAVARVMSSSVRRWAARVAA